MVGSLSGTTLRLALPSTTTSRASIGFARSPCATGPMPTCTPRAGCIIPKRGRHRTTRPPAHKSSLYPVVYPQATNSRRPARASICVLRLADAPTCGSTPSEQTISPHRLCHDPATPIALLSLPPLPHCPSQLGSGETLAGAAVVLLRVVRHSSQTAASTVGRLSAVRLRLTGNGRGVTPPMRTCVRLGLRGNGLGDRWAC